MQNVHATPRYARAITAAADLLGRLRLDYVFVGNVARSAWLGTTVDRGSLDLIALMSPEQKNAVAMMASNRGFRVERHEIEQTEELDLVPINFMDEEGAVRIHVLVASNALYGRMVPAGATAAMDALSFKVAAAEDFALLNGLSEDEESRRTFEALIARPDFNRASYNRRLVSIGLPQMAVAE